MTSLDDLIAGARTAKRAHADVDVALDQAVAGQVEALDLSIEELEQETVAVATRFDGELAETHRDSRLGDPRPTELTGERDRLLTEIREKIDALLTEREALTDGTLVTFRFTQLPGQAWAEISARHPARVDVTIDRVYGYNYHEVAKAAAAFHDDQGHGYSERILPADGDAEPGSEPVTFEQWAGIFEVISGHEFERIASALWGLNDYGPQQRIAHAGKASRAGSVNKSS